MISVVFAYEEPFLYMLGDSLVLLDVLLALNIGTLRTDLLVVLLQGSQVLAGLAEFALLLCITFFSVCQKGFPSGVAACLRPTPNGRGGKKKKKKTGGKNYLL